MAVLPSALTFVVLERGSAAPGGVFPLVVLRTDSWDDYTFRTLYSVTVRVSPKESIELGGVKILQRGMERGRPEIKERFTSLGKAFCSVGQDIEYYENLMQLPSKLRDQYLRSMRDAAADPNIENAFNEEAGWATSLMRFGQAVNALEAGGRLLRGNNSTNGELSFRFDWSYQNRVVPVDFTFDDTTELPGRCHVLIGYNGVGKTTLLAELALAASKGLNPNVKDGDSKLSGTDTTFGSVVAVSYSAFDTFKTPDSVAKPKRSTAGVSRTEVFGYVYCGLRRLSGKSSKAEGQMFSLKSIDEVEEEFAEALRTAGDRESRDNLRAAFDALSREPSFGRAGVDLSSLGEALSGVEAIDAFRRLSTGHKIVLNIVTQLAAHLQSRSLVLIDEPETHLHPPLMAALLRAVQHLLRAYDSFAVVATHSPVVVQESQSRYVRILERYVSDVILRDPSIETFGENIGAITRHIFSLDSSATDYQGTLERLAELYSLDAIDEMFTLGASSQARALILNRQAKS